MVDEFSSFAKMPKPIFREENFFELVRQSVFMHDVAHTQIDFDVETVSQDVSIYCDRRQISQALTNILKNAVESIETRAKSDTDIYRGKIDIMLNIENGTLRISISDNGIGLPDNRDRIIEPYVTTREKGTGLGLAIVKKIVEEHFGRINFANNVDRGAKIEIVLDSRILRDVGIGSATQGRMSAQENTDEASATA